MKTLILGQGRHGKDTVAEILRDEFGLSFQSSSSAALDAIWPALESSRGFTCKEFAYNERHDDRQLWYELIKLLNYSDKSTLCREILSNNDLYVGMRDNEEYEASKHLFDIILYVDASDRVKVLDPTMRIPYNEDSMIKIDNNGTEKELKAKVIELGDKYVTGRKTTTVC